MRHSTETPQWPDDVADPGSPARFVRRTMLKAAVLGTHHAETGQPGAGGLTPGPPDLALGYTILGKVLDVSPHILILDTETGEERFPLTASVRAWRGGPVPSAALRQGDHAIARRRRPGAAALDRIWAEAGRVTGTIIERNSPASLLVDEGPAKGRRIVLIAASAATRIQVRFPRLEPGYLIDVIGLRHDGFLQATIPATAQPPHRAASPPAPPLVGGHVPDPVQGTAVWHEPGEEPADLLGLAYPALDPETGCEREPPAVASCSGDLHAVDPHAAGTGCVRLPYLSLGSTLRLRNDCTGITRTLPVTGCGATARLFCDRCVQCGTSRRGRIADLTMAAFVELGGDLEAGCFNATMMIGS